MLYTGSWSQRKIHHLETSTLRSIKLPGCPWMAGRAASRFVLLKTQKKTPEIRFHFSKSREKTIEVFSICKSCPSRVDHFHNDWKVLNFASHSTWASASSLLATAISWAQDGWSVFMAPCFSSSPLFTYFLLSCLFLPIRINLHLASLGKTWYQKRCFGTCISGFSGHGVILGIPCLNLWGVSQRTSRI